MLCVWPHTLGSIEIDVARFCSLLCSEIEEKTQKERQERQNAAGLKESEMKMEAASALEKFHADRKAAAAAKLADNLCVPTPRRAHVVSHTQRLRGLLFAKRRFGSWQLVAQIAPRSRLRSAHRGERGGSQG